MAVADIEYANPLNDKGQKYPFRRDPKSGETSYFQARTLTDAELQGISVAINGILNVVSWKKGEAEQKFNTSKFRLERKAQALRMLLEVENVGVTIGDEALLAAYAPFVPGVTLAVGEMLVLDGKLKNRAEAQIEEGVTPEGIPIKVRRDMTLAEFWLSSRAAVCDAIVEAVIERAKGERAVEVGKD